MDAGETGRLGNKETGKQEDKEPRETREMPSTTASLPQRTAPEKAMPAQPAPARHSQAAAPQVPASAQPVSAPKPVASASSRPQATAGPQVIPAGESLVTTPAATGSAPNPQSAVRNPKLIKLVFRRSASLNADRKRLAEIVDVLSKYQGEDRFEITVEANGSARWQLDFPNNRTRVCKELQAELTQRLGPGGWKVEG